MVFIQPYLNHTTHRISNYMQMTLLSKFRPSHNIVRSFYGSQTLSSLSISNPAQCLLSIVPKFASLIHNYPARRSSMRSSFSTHTSITSSTEVRQSEEDQRIEDERKEKHRKSWARMKLSALILGSIIAAGSSAFIYSYGTSQRDDVGNIIIDQFSHLPKYEQIPKRAWNELRLFIKSVLEPSREKLLPDPLKEPYYQPKYTVVFEISGIMIHPDWTLSTGWRFKKRPAVDYFLKALGYPRTELVVYTSEHGMTGHPIVENLDTENVIMYKLYRDTTKYQYKDGAHIKDLGKLNRDLSKVIYVDWDNKAFQLNPENALRIPKWSGDDDDTGLVDLANLIRTIVDSDVDDVRPVLQYYSNFDNPLAEYRENQKKLLKIEESKSKAMHHYDDSLTKNWSGKMFGFRRHS